MAIFEQKSPRIMARLMQEFDLEDWQAAAILGNLGHESIGLTAFQEKRPTVSGSRGGWGWAQWTGPRRRQFEAWCKAKGYTNLKSDDANLGFLLHELKGSYNYCIGKLKAAPDFKSATVAFEKAYEAAGIKHYESRQRWADRALGAYRANKPPEKPVGRVGPIAAPDVETIAKPAPDVPLPPKAIAQSKIANGAIVGGIAGTIAPITEVAKQAAEAAASGKTVAEFVHAAGPWIMLVIAVVGIAFFVWKSRRNKLRDEGV